MAIAGTITGNFNVHDRRTVGINANVDIPVNWAPSTAYTDGVGANQANQLYQGSLALTAGAYSFDLAGALTDAYGTTLSLARVKALGFQNNSASNIMTLGAAASNPWTSLLGATGTMIVRPGGWFIIAAPDATGYVVTAATADLLKIAGTGTDGFYIFVLGGLT